MPNDLMTRDRFDAAILAVLAQDGRISITDLAKRIGLSKSPTQARLKRLEQSGVILGYRALLDPIRLGLDHVAFVEVRLNDTREAALRAFNAAVAQAAYRAGRHHEFTVRQHGRYVIRRFCAGPRDKAVAPREIRHRHLAALRCILWTQVILENVSTYKDIYSEWSVNEKVAFEVSYGGSVGGKRSLVAMKHVGVNVASDALMTAAYTGTDG